MQWRRLVPFLVLLSCLARMPARAAAFEDQAQATREYAVALGFEKKKLYPEAVTRWTKFIADWPKHERIAHAHFHLGVCQFRTEKLPEASATFRRVIATFPQFAHLDATRFNLGLVLYNVAVASQEPADYQTASAEFAQVPANSEYAADSRYYQAECLYSAEKPEEAIAVYRDLIARYGQAPILPDVFYALGTVEQEQSQHEKAVATFTTFLQKFADHALAAECRLRLAESQIQLKQYQPAEQQLAQLVGLAGFPYADYALLLHGKCRFDQDDFPKAAELYESLPARFKESTYIPVAHLSAGRSRYRAEQYPQAAAALKQVVALNVPEAIEGAYWLARTQIALEQPAEAVKTIDAALPKVKDDSDTLARLEFVRIESLAAQPDQEPATAAQYAAFHAKYPKHDLGPQALYRAALGALKHAEYEAARKHADAFLTAADYKEHPLVPDVLLLAGESRVLPEKADFAGAEPLYRRLATEFPEHDLVPRALVRIGLCLYGAGKHDAAVAHLQASLPKLKQPELTAEAGLLAGRAHAAAMRPKQAVPVLRAAWAAHQTWERGDEVLYELAVNLRAGEEPEPAATELIRLIDQYKQSSLRDRALYDLAEVRSDQMKFDQSVTRFRQLVAEYPMSGLVPAALYGAGAASFAKEDFAAAVTDLDKLIAGHAQSEAAPGGQYLRGLCRQRLMQHAEAVADFTAYLQTKPEAEPAAEARLAMATSQATLKQFEPAAQTLATLLQQKPDYARADQARYQLALAWLDAEKPDQAAAAFRELGEKHPESPLAPESWFRLGEYLEQTEQPDRAAEAYITGLKTVKRPELGERLQYRLGWVRFSQKEYPEAVTVFQQAVKDYQQGELVEDCAFLLGESLHAQDKLTDALPWFDRVVKAKHETYHARALYRAGECAAAAGQWPQSHAYYTGLLQAFPKFERIHDARYGAGLALQKQNRLDEARAVYLQVTKDTDTETAAKARFMMGECAFAKKDFKTALEDFLESALGYPYEEWQALGHLEAARCFIQLGDQEKARDALQTVIEQHAEHPRVKDAKALLAGLKN